MNNPCKQCIVFAMCKGKVKGKTMGIHLLNYRLNCHLLNKYTDTPEFWSDIKKLFEVVSPIRVYMDRGRR